jgi:hypothetical protein
MYPSLHLFGQVGHCLSNAHVGREPTVLFSTWTCKPKKVPFDLSIVHVALIFCAAWPSDALFAGCRSKQLSLTGGGWSADPTKQVVPHEPSQCVLQSKPVFLLKADRHPLSQTWPCLHAPLTLAWWPGEDDAAHFSMHCAVLTARWQLRQLDRPWRCCFQTDLARLASRSSLKSHTAV